MSPVWLAQPAPERQRRSPGCNDRWALAPDRAVRGPLAIGHTASSQLQLTDSAPLASELRTLHGRAGQAAASLLSPGLMSDAAPARCPASPAQSSLAQPAGAALSQESPHTAEWAGLKWPQLEIMFYKRTVTAWA